MSYDGIHPRLERQLFVVCTVLHEQRSFPPFAPHRACDRGSSLRFYKEAPQEGIVCLSIETQRWKVPAFLKIKPFYVGSLYG